MRTRAMRLIVYFDLPVITSEDRRRYSRFHRFLISNGFVMMQKSVYSKIALNATAAQMIRDTLQKNCPECGSVMVLSVSERQYQNIEVMVGERQKETIDTLDRFVVL